MEHLHMMTVLVRNRSGVLQRITGLFSRRGYNIQSIYAEQTKNPAISRVIIEVAGDDFIISQVEKQLAKLVDVLSVSQVPELQPEAAPKQPVLEYKNTHAVSEITLLDTTLRDGEQGEGISFTTADKIGIVKALDKLGIPLIEAGAPGINKSELAFFEEAKKLNLKRAQLAAFGSVRQPETVVEEDAGIQALVQAGTKIVCVFGKCWELHVTELLHITPEENLNMISDTVRYLHGIGKNVIFDAGHFYDGYRANPEYALKALRTAEDAGASCIVLCDTNGGCMPEEAYRITAETVKHLHVQLGVHFHDDMGFAAANSLLAVEAGASHIQGTCTGLGERCGNANLSALIPTLQIKRKLHCIPQENMKHLTSTAVYINDIANVSLSNRAPYVGKSAFAHKSDMHIAGVSRNPRSFEHIAPELIGNKRNVLVSGLGGKAALFDKISPFLPDLTLDSEAMDRLAEILCDLEGQGYSFEAATASMELAVLKELGRFTPFFELSDFKIIGEKGSASSAMVKIKANGRYEMTAEEGDGPVHALDAALRKAVRQFYPGLESMKLTDYKVRVIDPKDATAATVRVLAESTDGDTKWTTVGVSRDIINASLLALVDSIEYKLLKDSRTAEEEIE